MNPPVQPALTALVPRVYPLRVEAVECGLECGWNRAYKHDDDPSATTIKSEMLDAILGEICERFDILQPTIK